MTILCFRVLVFTALLRASGAWAEAALRGTRAMFLLR
jgi:hypothetical protein